MVRRAPWGARRRYAIVTTEGMTPFRGIAPNKLESKVLCFLFVALRPPSNFTNRALRWRFSGRADCQKSALEPLAKEPEPQWTVGRSFLGTMHPAGNATLCSCGNDASP